MTAPTAISDSTETTSISCVSSSPVHPVTPTIAALHRLSENIETLIRLPDLDFCSDAKIAVSGREVPIHRCVLAARSPLFRTVFSRPDLAKEKVVNLELKELAKDFHVGFDALMVVLGYLYSGKVESVAPKGGVCVCVDEDCVHVGCRPAVDFVVEVIYASFTFMIHELVALYQGHLLDILPMVAADDILVILSVANICGKACESLLTKCIELIVKSDIDIITLEKTLPQDTVKQIIDSRSSLGLSGQESNGFPNKHVKRIHRALDSDDVELVRMLLREADTTLDDAYALHYAVAYCDPKTTMELLELALADVNHKNPRGYTVLHVAAMRKEPKIIVSLLTKGARPSDLTLDGRKALQISKRLTKSQDYYRSTEEGMATPKDRLCIEVLEQAERREPLLGEASVSLAMAGDDLRNKLLYLENRVSLAKLLFPMEAKVAMDIAQVDGTLEFQLASNSMLSPGNQSTTVDLNETPFKMKEEHLARMRALSKTVELGKRFFPRCSEVLNKIVDGNGVTELTYHGNESSEERLRKKHKRMELEDVLTKAFSEDKEEFDRSTASSCCSSPSIEGLLTLLNKK